MVSALHLSEYTAPDSTVSDSEWIIDSGASKHMTPNADLIVNHRRSNVGIVVIANKAKAPVSATGDVFVNNADTKTIKLANVLHVPDIAFNLMSISAMTKRGHKVVFDGHECQVFGSQLVGTTASRAP